jgi:hypothetical protein
VGSIIGRATGYPGKGFTLFSSGPEEKYQDSTLTGLRTISSKFFQMHHPITKQYDQTLCYFQPSSNIVKMVKLTWMIARAYNTLGSDMHTQF